MNLANRTKLAKLLALTTSNHDGEALSAARKANALVKRQGKTWQAIFNVDDQDNRPAHIIEAERLLRRGAAVISEYEKNFLTGVLGFSKLSPAQDDKFAEIANKIDVATRATPKP